MDRNEDIVEHAKMSARSAAEAAKKRAAEFADEQKSTVSDSLQQFASAIEKAGEELARQDQTLAAGIVRQAGDGLGSFSRSINSSSISEIVDSVRRFGRDNPAAFIGGAVLAGLALGRFAQASSGGQQTSRRSMGQYDQSARSRQRREREFTPSASAEAGDRSVSGGASPSAPAAAGSTSAGVAP